MIIENQVQIEEIETKRKNVVSKIWFGNPQIELTEGLISYDTLSYLMNKTIEGEYDESELELIKQYIWENNIKNNLINSSELCCVNIPNKISINEFLHSISIYLSYINVIRVLKSPIPNFYFIYLQMKNKEYSNIFYNTFNYSKINPIEKEYYNFAEVKEIKFEEIFKNGLKYYGINRINSLISPKAQNKINQENFKHTTDFNSLESISLKEAELINDEINMCPICLDQIDQRIVHVLCGHIVHIECCLKLDDDKCPLCRYNLSPANISTCSLCSCENDLWMCLVCGSINCGAEGGSNNHRKEHYVNSGHTYAKGLGETHNVTFDFTRNSPLNIWFQNSIMNYSNVNIENFDYTKDPKEKVEFIMSEYNSIISSQLESQRLYYIKLVREISDTNKNEETKLDEEIENMKKILEKSCEEVSQSVKNKKLIMSELKSNEDNLKLLESCLKESDMHYKEIIESKEKLEGSRVDKEMEIKYKIYQVEEEIDELQNQIKDLKVHTSTLGNVKGSSKSSLKSNEIAGASIEFMISTDTDNKRRGKKKK